MKHLFIYLFIQILGITILLLNSKTSNNLGIMIFLFSTTASIPFLVLFIISLLKNAKIQQKDFDNSGIEDTPKEYLESNKNHQDKQYHPQNEKGDSNSQENDSQIYDTRNEDSRIYDTQNDVHINNNKPFISANVPHCREYINGVENFGKIVLKYHNAINAVIFSGKSNLMKDYRFKNNLKMLLELLEEQKDKLESINGEIKE